jgi:hypothetical protein
MRKQRPPVAVRLEGAKDPKFHCRLYREREGPTVPPMSALRRVRPPAPDLLGFYPALQATSDDLGVTTTAFRLRHHPNPIEPC